MADRVSINHEEEMDLDDSDLDELENQATQYFLEQERTQGDGGANFQPEQTSEHLSPAKPVCKIKKTWEKEEEESCSTSDKASRSLIFWPQERGSKFGDAPIYQICECLQTVNSYLKGADAGSQYWKVTALHLDCVLQRLESAIEQCCMHEQHVSLVAEMLLPIATELLGCQYQGMLSVNTAYRLCAIGCSLPGQITEVICREVAGGLVDGRLHLDTVQNLFDGARILLLLTSKSVDFVRHHSSNCVAGVVCKSFSEWQFLTTYEKLVVFEPIIGSFDQLIQQHANQILDGSFQCDCAKKYLTALITLSCDMINSKVQQSLIKNDEKTIFIKTIYSCVLHIYGLGTYIRERCADVPSITWNQPYVLLAGTSALYAYKGMTTSQLAKIEQLIDLEPGTNKQF